MLPMSLRTDQMEAKYQEAKLAGTTTPLHLIPSIQEWRFWRTVPNQYYGDSAFKQEEARMLIPKRIVAKWWHLFPWEALEFLWILYKLENYQGQFTFNLGATRSIQDHLHMHINQFLNSREDRRL